MSESGDLALWYQGLPKIFRTVFTAMFAGPLLLRFQLLGGDKLVANWQMVYYKFQIWRPVTACFITGVSFHWLISLYMFYQYGKRLSEGTFSGKPADEAWFYVVVMVCCNAIGYIFQQVVFYYILLFAVIYVWAQCNRDVVAQFYFGIQIKAAYLPWAFAGLNFVLSNDVTGFLGNIAGHIYFFLKYKWPIDFGGQDFIATPMLFEKWLPSMRQVAGRNVEFRRPTNNNTDNNGHNWGTGHNL